MNKTYNKAMIELVYEIRRRIESEYKPGIKFANPELLSDLTLYYKSCTDTILRALIKELMVHAGEKWEARLKGLDNEIIPKHTVKSYRGVVSIEETPDIPNKVKQPKSDLIYRGRVVKR